MKYDNRNYPHPVLGINEDIEGSFSGHLTVKSNIKTTVLNPILTLKNETLEKLIESGNASYMMHIYCRGTMFRRSYIVKDPLSDSFEIPTGDLSGETEVDFFLCANDFLRVYKNTGANKIFDDSSFVIDKGYILAYGGKGKFFANKSPEKLKAVSSFMRIKCSGSDSGPFKLHLDEDKYITIEVSKKDHDQYLSLILNQKNWSILHLGIVFPALIELANMIQNESPGIADMMDSQWFIIFQKLLEEAKGNSTIEKVQYILDLPLNRALIDLDPEV